ncbi:uncharacterized protein PV09_09678 [Verruconis gallopava]|uniref:D-arabinitol 2-dehydrogenase [ribulose-forming] n=1 Tax=Verruconis gallopava TaxID=253628 RepID=A0A0D2AI00_9PEZI|nr:uncharacterized protein PV09_09678 [Verruconis gallopava]KIV98513.1 hypothetical protein PV09_09678 [Verruconis gallopava]
MATVNLDSSVAPVSSTSDRGKNGVVLGTPLVVNPLEIHSNAPKNVSIPQEWSPRYRLVLGKALATSGAHLAIVDINIEESKSQAAHLEGLFKELNPNETNPIKITAHFADVSDTVSVNAAVEEIIAAHGRIDNLISGAAIIDNISAVYYPIERAKKIWAVNVDGSYLFSVAVAKHLMERNSQGSILLIGSMSGSVVNVPQVQTPYNVSKAAVRHMAAYLAVEWAPFGIRVNCLSLGYIITDLTQKIIDARPDLNERWTSLTPQGRLGTPENLTGAMTFLLSDASLYVTGADLRVDGGYTVV